MLLPSAPGVVDAKVNVTLDVEAESPIGSCSRARWPGRHGKQPDTEVGRSPRGSHRTRSTRPREDRHARLIVLGVASLS